MLEYLFVIKTLGSHYSGSYLAQAHAMPPSAALQYKAVAFHVYFEGGTFQMGSTESPSNCQLLSNNLAALGSSNPEVFYSS